MNFKTHKGLFQNHVLHCIWAGSPDGSDQFGHLDILTAKVSFQNGQLS